MSYFISKVSWWSKVFTVQSFNCTKFLLYKVFTVHSFYCTKFLLYKVFTIQSFYCSKFLLYKVFSVQSFYCSKFLLYKVFTVKKSLEYKVFTVQSFYCTKSLVYKVYLDLQISCCSSAWDPDSHSYTPASIFDNYIYTYSGFHKNIPKRKSASGMIGQTKTFILCLLIIFL